MNKKNDLKCIFSTYEDILENDLLNTLNIIGIIEFSNYKKPLNKFIDQSIPYINLELKNLSGKEYIELWVSENEAQYGSSNQFKYSFNETHMFGIASSDNELEQTEKTAYSIYQNLFEITKNTHYPYINRIWNYIPDINTKNNAKIEHYTAFCRGRWNAFKNNYPFQYPAGTGIGNNTKNTGVCFLSSASNETIFVENPKQTPAYHYHNEGAPCFSRGCYDNTLDTFCISGTASIINNLTKGTEDIKTQFKTTLKNINTLISKENLLNYNLDKNYTLKDIDCIKVYIKQEKDSKLIKDLCSHAFSNKASIAYLQADICRPELLLEIEGIIQN